MGVIVRMNVGNLVSAAQLNKDDFQQIGELIRSNILERTLRGVDAQNRKFVPYSAGYAAQRAKEGIPQTNVTLELSGAMLERIKIEAEENKVTVAF